MIARSFRRYRAAVAQGSDKHVSALSVVQAAAQRMKPEVPTSFRLVLVQCFRPAACSETGCFAPEVHGGDRAKVVTALKRCRLVHDAESCAPATTNQWTREFLQELWREATQRSLALNADGTPMRAAVAEVARAVCSRTEAPPATTVPPAVSVPSPVVLNGSAVPPEPEAFVEDDLSSPLYETVETWLRPGALEGEIGRPLELADFDEKVPLFWREQLLRVDRAAAARLIRQLGGDNQFGWLRSKAGDAKASEKGLFKQFLQWRRENPKCVLLVQIGDFFESEGVDAIMLVQWCGLNPMGGKVRAGFPAAGVSLQQNLDGLTGAGLSAAVIVQMGAPGQKNQPRLLKQVVTPGAPTYLFGHELKRSNDEGPERFSEGRPYVAVRLRTDGLLYAELRPFRREVRYRANVTPEGAEALLAENNGIALPIFVDGPKGSSRQADRWDWFPEQRKWLGFPQDVTDEQFVEASCKQLCEMLKLPQVPAFLKVKLDGKGALQPLSVSTAQNLGVLPRSGIPDLIKHMLPADAPRVARNLLKRWLLAPRSERVVHNMRKLLSIMAREKQLSLPPLRRCPSIAKVVAFLTARSASETLFGEIRGCCVEVLKVLQDPKFLPLQSTLLELVAAELGEETLTCELLVHSMQEAVTLLDKSLGDPYSRDEASVPYISEDEQTVDTFRRFLEAQEPLRGAVSSTFPGVVTAEEELKECRNGLAQALQQGLEPNAKDALVFNPFDNDLTFKQKPEEAEAAKTRKGKEKKDRFTTPALDHAMDKYLRYAKRYEVAVRKALRDLCSELEEQVWAVRAAISAAELLVATHGHTSHALGRGWTLPEVAGSDEPIKAVLAPYWLEAGDAVTSKVELGDRGAIATGPNMSGKSTLMRAIGGVALLVNCGFFAPCSPGSRVPRYRQVIFLAAEGDRPSEGVSAFGQEAQLSATLLRQACPGTLALVDEFGRGTEPAAAQAAVAALVEELASRRTHFVVATHIHRLADMPLKIPDDRPGPVSWRMGLERSRSGALRWTYRLEEGICRDSYAEHTLGRFGWPKEVLSRFHQHLDRLRLNEEVEVEATAHQQEEQRSLPPASPVLAEVSTEEPSPLFLECLLKVTRSSLDQVVQLSPKDSPPASLCSGTAVLYILCLRAGQLYVGQTDHLQGRLASHRRRFGESLEEVWVLAVENTAAARQLETALQRELLRVLGPGALVSWHDQSHRHFGQESFLGHQDVVPSNGVPSPEESCDILGDPQRLREISKYLADLAGDIDSRRRQDSH